MEFFNRKEEVLEIQLTQEGKRLLAKGEFKPFYYEFFDDDILYETKGSGFTEEQNSSVPRIKETPRVKTQNIVYGLETELNKLKQDLNKVYGKKEDKNKKYLYNKNHDPLKYALGLGDYSTNYVPAWNVSLDSGLINTSSFSATYNPEADYYEYIPQLTCTSSFVYQARNDIDNYDELVSSIDDEIIYKSDIFEDKTYYVIRQRDNLQALIKEVNSTFDKENFDVEIFEVESVDGEKENLKNLYFFKNVINFETFYPDLPPITEEESQPYDVEWYFSMILDDQIEEQAKEKMEFEGFNPYFDQNADDSQEPC
jgi:hypothetical protein